MSNPQPTTTDEQLQKLREFDLSRINQQLRNDGYDNVEELEAKFRRFIKLIIENPDSEITPSPEVDEYWHKFILDTREYHRFCEEVVGQFIHHMPNLDS